jgi:hypothetical protein
MDCRYVTRSVDWPQVSLMSPPVTMAPPSLRTACTDELGTALLQLKLKVYLLPENSGSTGTLAKLGVGGAVVAG